MGDRKVALETFRQALDQVRKRNGRGIGGDNGTGFAVLFNFSIKALLDFELLNDHFDNKVTV